MRARISSTVAFVVGAALFVGTSGCRVRVVEVGSWDQIGSRLVDLTVDHDSIEGLAQGTFRAIRIEVERSDLEMYDIKLHFGNGDIFQPSVRHHFQEGTWSRVINLPGGARHIRQIEFSYKTSLPRGEKAKVIVWGLR